MDILLLVGWRHASRQGPYDAIAHSSGVVLGCEVRCRYIFYYGNYFCRQLEKVQGIVRHFPSPELPTLWPQISDESLQQ